MKTRNSHMNCGLVVDQARRIPVSTCNQAGGSRRAMKKPKYRIRMLEIVTTKLPRISPNATG